MDPWDKFIGRLVALAAFVVVVPIAGLLLAWFAGWLKREIPPEVLNKPDRSDQ